jgi:hypothetical protein
MCLRNGHPFPTDGTWPITRIGLSQEDHQPEIPDWCPLPDKTDEKRGPGALAPAGLTGK